MPRPNPGNDFLVLWFIWGKVDGLCVEEFAIEKETDFFAESHGQDRVMIGSKEHLVELLRGWCETVDMATGWRMFDKQGNEVDIYL